MKPHRGTLILVLGILSLIVCGPLGIAAWIMGNNDLREIDAGMMDPEGRSMTQAGRICGIIACILTALSVLLAIGLVVLALGGAAASSLQ
jgi:hypothetical protein